MTATDRPTAPRHLRVEPLEPAPLATEPTPRRPSRRWMAVFGALLVTAIAGGAALTYVGVETVRDSRAGRSVSHITDPTAPGFEAFLEPTPTLLVVNSHAGSLVSAALIALNSGDAGGSVVLVPGGLRVSSDDDAYTLVGVAGFASDPAAAAYHVQRLLTVGMPEVVVVDDDRWAELLAPVGPVTIDNPDAVGEFPAGALTIAPEQVGGYLAAIGEGESELARLYRQQVFFDAWATAVADSTDPAVVPGEVDSGLGRFVRGLAAGQRQITTLPVTEEPHPSGSWIEVDVDGLEQLLPGVVPFPTASSPGARVRVRLLDGTGEPDHVLRVAPRLVPAGSEVVVVGNAASFDHATTEIRYHNPVVERAAKHLQEALGAGEVIDDPRQTDSFDVTIVLGTDV